MELSELRHALFRPLESKGVIPAFDPIPFSHCSIAVSRCAIFVQDEESFLSSTRLNRIG
jgi:hypothetical protein